jgi:tetratricopeptide (TPR) repeat protein/tRNA A-37 threonylcarbamoyl transferase component Bud32
MGVVYKARQVRANRLVALKMVLSGAHASKAQLERFRIEGEAVARLQHPNIVQVYEVAEHDGRPFFSLEFLDGGSLVDHLDGTPWPTLKTAELVETLALAMQHAHDKGIVHRDLKPANILLGGTAKPNHRDGKRATPSKGIPIITDFGLAKLMESGTGQTQSGDVLGTPSYMAPEQAEGNISAIGPCTDVYALGAILYELLTGRPPFKGTTLLETLEQVRIQEPVPPRQLHLQAPRDLETICLKCLHKEPARRYPSALELAEDLGRFQAGEPIKARPVSLAGRLYRWGRRNPKIAGLLAALVLVTTVGFISVSALWLHAETERQRAETNWEEAEAQRGRAENNLKGALAAVDHYFTKVSENRLLNEPGSESLRRDLLLAARDYYERFIRENEKSPELQAALGKSLYYLGQILADLHSPAEGIKYHRRALVILEQQAKEHPQEASPRVDLATSHHDLGRLYRLTSQNEPSREHYKAALALWEQLVRAHPAELPYRAGLTRTQQGLGNLAKVKGEYQEAEAHYQQALDGRRQLVKQEPRNQQHQRDLAVNCDNLAAVHELMGQSAKTDQEALEAHKALRQLVKNQPTIIRDRDDLARNCYNRGNRLARRGETTQARAAYEEAAAIWQQLERDHPLVAQFHTSSVTVLYELGLLHQRKQENEEAEKQYRKGLKICENLIAAGKKTPALALAGALCRTSPLAPVFPVRWTGYRIPRRFIQPELNFSQECSEGRSERRRSSPPGKARRTANHLRKSPCP